MKPKHALVAFLAVVAVSSCLLAFLDAQGVSEPGPLALGSTVVYSALIFAWFRLDSEARGYKRSPFLNVAVVALGVVAVPYYLLRSRSKGERLKAMGRFVGFFLLLIVALVVGSIPGSLLGEYL